MRTPTMRLIDRFSNTDREPIALCSIDAAIHTALHLCRVAPGDYVFVPSYTFWSYVTAVTAVGGVPVFIDSDPTSHCMSAPALETALLWAELQNKPPRAVVIDNAFGAIADLDTLMPICTARSVPVIELACDALGGKYKGKSTGASGDYGITAFKRVSGIGAILFAGNERETAEKFARLRYSDGESHDYRMPDVVAELDMIGLDGLERKISRCRRNQRSVSALPCVCPTNSDAASYALVPSAARTRLADLGLSVKAPPPVHTLPRFSGAQFFEHEPGFCVCDMLSGYALVDLDIALFKCRGLLSVLRDYVID